MKKIKLLFAAAILLAVASAFTTTAKKQSAYADLYYADYSVSPFAWVKITGAVGTCETNLNHYCTALFDAQPAPGTIPTDPGARKGDYLQP